LWQEIATSWLNSYSEALKMIVNTNINALVAGNAYANAAADYAQASTRISTQLRVNSAKDDPVGLGIANRFKSKIASYAKAIDNINQGVSALSTAETAMSSIQTILTSMKTLATSSASGTASVTTLASNQLAFVSYMTQLNTAAKSATFNGYSLLDGSTPTLNVQTGIDAGDTTTFTFGSLLSSALGSGSSLALTSLGSSVAGTGSLTAMASGDLLLNGFTVGASLSSDDTASYSSKSGSAIAKAAAINRITGTSNIKAEIGTTDVVGSAMTTSGTGTAGTITINGTAIAVTLATTNDYATNRAAMVTAINLNSGTTFVTATDNLSTTNGITLKATDGRNITVAFDGVNLTASNTGVGAAGTYAGVFTLRRLDQTSIVVSNNVGGTLANADLAAGTYTGNVAQFSSKARSGSIAAPTALTAGDLMINGYSIGATFTSDDTASVATTTSSTKASSAISTAAAINRQTSLTNVSATANTNVVEGTGFSAGLVDTIYLNGTSITAALTAASSAADVVTLLNTYSGQTFVTATNNGSGVTLTATDGRNISIGVSYNGAAVDGTRIGLGGNAALTGAAATSAGAMTYISTVKLTSTNGTFTVTPGSNGSTSFSTLGFREGTYGGGSTATKVSSLNISSSTGGTNALTTLADAINTVSQYQATVGAFQNRMTYQTSYVNNMNTASTTAYNKIMNYDLAAETANLATAQIKQNGAMAMLAQANISQEMVAYLLKKYIP